MILICDKDKCTGCGMCANICPSTAITMKEGKHGFIFPTIDQSKCIDCKLCEKKCPSNMHQSGGSIIDVYAAWNKNKNMRKRETSGGVFSAIAKEVIRKNGVVFGVAWSKDFLPEHIMVESDKDLQKLFGSKYAQSNTGSVYINVKKALTNKKQVLFSGTPCQVAALNSFLGKEYDNLLTVDLVCHGVPSSKMLENYYREFSKNQIPTSVSLREKDPYWDYSYVKINFTNKLIHKELTINDAYFNLFNIGYSLRTSCHSCKYANDKRHGDITLADFWGYLPHNIKMINYNKGTSLVLTNTEKGQVAFERIKEKLVFERENIDKAKRGNKCLYEPFAIEKTRLNSFWHDVENGMSIIELDKKYTANSFQISKKIFIIRIYNKWRWILNK